MRSQRFWSASLVLTLAGIETSPLLAQASSDDLGWAPSFQDLTYFDATGPFAVPTPAGQALGVVESGPLAGLYLAGEFGDSGDPENRVLRFAENASQVIGSGFPGNMSDLCAYDDGTGEALYLSFGAGASQPGFASLRRWDGSTWEALPAPAGHFYIYALTTWNDGTGDKLIAALSSPAGAEFAGVAAFDGQVWTPLGLGLSGFVEDFEVLEQGTTSVLVAGGNFNEVGTPPYAVSNIASYDGTGWTPLGEGSSSTVRVLQTHDDGRGPELYAGGTHYDSETGETQYLRSWNGSQWRSIEGVTTLPIALASVQPGDALEAGLYAGLNQDFSTVTQASFGLGRWDGNQWHPVGTGLPGSTVRDLQVHSNGADPSLFAAFFHGGADSGDRGFARWGLGALSRYESLTGCGAEKPSLLPMTGALDLGLATTLRLFGDIGGAASLWYYYFGADGSSASGCGLELPGVGELLLDAQQPIELFASVPASPLVVGTPALHFTMPAAPNLVGLEIGIQAVGLLVNGSPPRLTRSIVGTLQFAP